jgi:hypothetical protein
MKFGQSGLSLPNTSYIPWLTPTFRGWEPAVAQLWSLPCPLRDWMDMEFGCGWVGGGEAGGGEGTSTGKAGLYLGWVRGEGCTDRIVWLVIIWRRGGVCAARIKDADIHPYPSIDFLLACPPAAPGNPWIGRPGWLGAPNPHHGHRFIQPHLQRV